MSSVSDRTLLITIVANVTLIIGYLISAVNPERRVWPIGDSSWRWWFNWSNLSVVFAGFPVLAYLDRDSFIFTSKLSKTLGGLLSVVGMGFSLSALFELGWMESTGREGELRTDGIYQYTRNPQSVGFIPFIIGTIVAVNSRKLLVHGILTIIVYALFPFAEEPWLREQYGDEYEEYCDQTPRFIGWKSVREFFET
ncbi:isoprenylcysteine carboxylmethyltransferase family protein [Halonotius terrestris]|jgi:protein-S-isoprenylcysteine O-methyltransferase Ste14|uniref:Isoprenylcysteine carboxylmethyltransferase family protein n=1 Tax=Halonotius terrestris TaxID=2487750 RepID=A0A8J8TAJ1_9EURY|nr:isoprenylcysteine carboxylmethyltransferase family protein [Halonotius terrestris]TQQ78756.1 isoprenylcysteine carboxylmethyltransferase family protein [Halonotius terrestris]